MKKLLFYVLFLGFSFLVLAGDTFDFAKEEPIDVIIPCAPKDIRSLELCIEGIKTYGINVNRVIVISSEPLSNLAEWFDEAQFPFCKEQVAHQIFKDKGKAEAYLKSNKDRSGWILQQLLKLYASFVIPNISSNILCLDSDTIFLKPVSFYDEETGAGFFNPGVEYHKPYFEHAQRLIPGFQKIHKNYSGISHHMLIQRPILQTLFQVVEEYHQKEFWCAFCDCIDQKYLWPSCASEYEIYFNFTLSCTDQCKIRKLHWKNIPFRQLESHRKRGQCDYVSCHTYLRR